MRDGEAKFSGADSCAPLCPIRGRRGLVRNVARPMADICTDKDTAPMCDRGI